MTSVLVIATGLSVPNVPSNWKTHSEGYEDFSIDPLDYEKKSVLILGMKIIFEVIE